MKKKLFILLQHFVPQHLLSRFMGLAANCRWPWWKNFMISTFVRRYQVDLSLAQSASLDDYPSFNSFFTRALKSSARPIASEADLVVSPIDGSISQLGHLEEGRLLQAKGAYFSVEALLAKSRVAADFYQGAFATFYLSPKDYHRVHMPLAGKLLETIYVPGKLFSVNPSSVAAIPELFSRNERLVCIFETVQGRMAVILIGAMMVGQIETIWGLVERSKRIVQRRYADQEQLLLDKGAELGRFKMGSSVILLFEKETLAWLPSLAEKSLVEMGRPIAALLKKSPQKRSS